MHRYIMHTAPERLDASAEFTHSGLSHPLLGPKPLRVKRAYQRVSYATLAGLRQAWLSVGIFLAHHHASSMPVSSDRIAASALSACERMRADSRS